MDHLSWYTGCLWSMTRFQQALKGAFFKISTCGLLQIVGIEKGIFFITWRYLKNHGNSSDLQKSGNSDKKHILIFPVFTTFFQITRISTIFKVSSCIIYEKKSFFCTYNLQQIACRYLQRCALESLLKRGHWIETPCIFNKYSRCSRPCHGRWLHDCTSCWLLSHWLTGPINLLI